MSKESEANAGLLGKVAKFIKSPASDWLNLDRSDSAGSSFGDDTPQSRQALKEMIERKRRNDFVRKREFDMLRKIRRKGKGQNSTFSTLELTSSYSSSQMARGADKQDGEETPEQILRRIDEIEAQIAHGWFRKEEAKAKSSQPLLDTKPPFKPQTAPPNRPEPPVLKSEPVSGVAKASPVAGVPMKPGWADSGLSGLEVQFGQEDSFKKGIPSNGSAAPEFVVSAPFMQLPAQQQSPKSQPAQTYDSALGNNLEVVALRHDPEVEEAAISFANGETTAAELILLKLVGDSGSRRHDVNVWLALFDLYRVTGKSDSFDGLVLEFTDLFGRSAPQWERAQNDRPASEKIPMLQVAHEGAFTWASPSQFSDAALTALTRAAQRTAPPWRIDWRYVKSVDPVALPGLNALFTQWADTPTQLQFLGGEQLLAVLAGASPTGNKDADPAWWDARLALLRLMGKPDPFDQAALDYCITYEISPPAWAPPKGSYMPLTAEEQLPVASAPVSELEGAPSFVPPMTLAGDSLADTGVFEATLEGEILGSADQALARLPSKLERVQTIDFDCRALRRVDFAAAGELLNWALKQQGEGRTVTFSNVHRLLAAFFGMVGIDTAAQVVRRKD